METATAVVIAVSLVVLVGLIVWLLIGLRERRVGSLSIRPLEPNERQRFADLWKRQQARFVDDPTAAVVEADALVAEVMNLRGYPMAEFERRAADLSIEHPRVVEHYRVGHALVTRLRDGVANMEDVRRAMLHFRTLFFELMQVGPTFSPRRA